jgi:hypothetical protein
LAWLTMLMPACARTWLLMNSVISEAKSVSRMFDSVLR